MGVVAEEVGVFLLTLVCGFILKVTDSICLKAGIGKADGRYFLLHLLFWIALFKI